MFIFANSADTDEMPHSVAFHLFLHCLSKYLFTRVFPVYKGCQTTWLIELKFLIIDKTFAQDGWQAHILW